MAALPRCEAALFKQSARDYLPITAGAPLSSWTAAPSHLAASVSFMCSVKDLVTKPPQCPPSPAKLSPAQPSLAQPSPASCQFGPAEA